MYVQGIQYILGSHIIPSDVYTKCCRPHWSWRIEYFRMLMPPHWIGPSTTALRKVLLMTSSGMMVSLTIMSSKCHCFSSNYGNLIPYDVWDANHLVNVVSASHWQRCMLTAILHMCWTLLTQCSNSYFWFPSGIRLKSKPLLGLFGVSNWFLWCPLWLIYDQRCTNYD